MYTLIPAAVAVVKSFSLGVPAMPRCMCGVIIK